MEVPSSKPLKSTRPPSRNPTLRIWSVGRADLAHQSRYQGAVVAIPPYGSGQLEVSGRGGLRPRGVRVAIPPFGSGQLEGPSGRGLRSLHAEVAIPPYQSGQSEVWSSPLSTRPRSSRRNPTIPSWSVGRSKLSRAVIQLRTNVAIPPYGSGQLEGSPL